MPRPMDIWAQWCRCWSKTGSLALALRYDTGIMTSITENQRGVSTVKAIVKTARGRGNVELQEVPEPKPGPGQVVIEVKAAGVCGSDLHIDDDEIQISIKPPVIMVTSLPA